MDPPRGRRELQPRTIRRNNVVGTLNIYYNMILSALNLDYGEAVIVHLIDDYGVVACIWSA
jgi:hypothetical protein